MLSGKKKFDLRLNNFTIHEGDMLELVEVDENRKLTGRKLQKKVTYVKKFKIDQLFWPVEEIEKKGFQIISLE